MILEMKKVKAVKIHEVVEGWDDGDPLYEVDATLTFDGGNKVRYYFDWVRAGHLRALKKPKSKDAYEMLSDLVCRFYANEHKELSKVFFDADEDL